MKLPLIWNALGLLFFVIILLVLPFSSLGLMFSIVRDGHVVRQIADLVSNYLIIYYAVVGYCIKCDNTMSHPNLHTAFSFPFIYLFIF